MTLTRTITTDEIASYRRDGAVLLRGVLGASTLALLEAGVEEAVLAPGNRSTVRGTAGEGETVVANYLGERCPSLGRLIRSGVPGELAARVMETPSAQLILDQIFYKTAGDIVPTPWHQDTPFLRVRGHDMARVWLTCDRSPSDVTVQVVRGSHRWNVVYGADLADRAVRSEESGFTSRGIGDDRLPTAPDVARYADSFDILAWDVEPGDALVFQGNMLHGASGRTGHDRPRRAYATVWGGPALCYHQPAGKAFPPPGGTAAGPIPDGDPIGRHEAAFPIGWRAETDAAA